MKKIALLVLLILGLFIVSSCATGKVSVDPAKQVKVFKSPTCGCCVGWIPYLEKEGFQVNAINMANMNSIKEQYNIPRNMESCHTAIIGDYFIEGHVPMEAIEKLLQEQPDIDGIALPNMLSGSPGMPGAKRGTWTIYAVKDGQVTEFMRY